jgi:RNA polymerase II-associated factor 1
MSSSSQQRPPAPRTYPQDYIARIRYYNSLPVPVCPPKLLDIPNTAFVQYTDTSFASTLARSEPINIEVDSELGMPLDLVHVPQVFEGDNSVLLPLDPPPPVDPRDRLLLRPAASLGKPVARSATGGSTVSFLRRTEYISSEQARSSFKSTTSLQLVANTKGRRTQQQQRPEDTDPVRILAAVMKGFEVANPNPDDPSTGSTFAQGDKAAANAERNWKELKHPNKPTVKAVETFPLLPHLDGTSDTGGYMVFKFTTSPTDEGKIGKRDDRIDMSLFQPVEPPDQEDGAEDEDRKECFDFYIPDSEAAAASVKRKFADEEIYRPDEEFRYTYLRRYETKSHQPYHNGLDQQPEEVAIIFHSGDETQPRGAYFYPILTRYVIRPKRKTKMMGMMMNSQSQRDYYDDDEEPPAEALKLRIREMDGAEKRRRVEYMSRWEGSTIHQQQRNSSSMDPTHQDETLDEDEDAPGEEE